MKSLLYLPVFCLTLCLSARASSSIDFFEGQLDDLQKQASEYGKMSMVYFYASWCMPCQWMEKNTYQNNELADYLNQYYFPIRVNIDAPQGLQEKKKYQVTLLPTILIFDSQGNLIARYEESMGSEKLLNLLKKNNHFPSALNKNKSVANSPILHAPKPKNIYYPPLIPEQAPSVAPENQPGKQTYAALPPTNSYQSAPSSPFYVKPTEYYFGVQIGAFSSRQNAEKEMKALRNKLNEQLHLITEHLHNRKIYKIIAGKFNAQNEALQCLGRVKNQRIFGFVKKIDSSAAF